MTGAAPERLAEVIMQRESETMIANIALQGLGYDARDRVAIIHADDIGMLQATVSAFSDLVDFGTVKSGSLMVPCGWFPQAVALCRKHPEVDAGVHITLTSESAACRWRPLSTTDPASGLLDETGYLHPDRDSLWAHADPLAARQEAEAQIECARLAGLQPTHVDCHMHAATNEAFLPHYVDIARQNGLPALVVRDWPTWRDATRHRVGDWERDGLPVFDHLHVMNLRQSVDDPIPAALRALEQLPPGLSCVLIHPARDTPELRAVTHDWRMRVADYRAFSSREMLRYLRDSAIQLIDYRTLRSAMKPEEADGATADRARETSRLESQEKRGASDDVC